MKNKWYNKASNENGSDLTVRVAYPGKVLF